MPGRNHDPATPPRTEQQKDGVGGSSALVPSAASHRKSQARRRIFRELVHIAAEQGASIPLGISTGDALQECLDRAVALMRFAQQQVDQLPYNDTVPTDPDTGLPLLASLSYQDDPLYEVIDNPQGPDVVQRHRYLLMETEARVEVEKLAAMMTQLGIAERVVRVEEAKAALLIAAVRDAAISAGFDHDDVRKLGEALRHRVEEGLGQVRQPAHGTVGPSEKVNEVMKNAEKGPVTA